MSNVLITGESNFDEKNVEKVFNMCSTEQSCIHIGITCYKIGTLAVHVARQGMRQEFGSAGAVCSIKESSGPQNQRVHIVLKASKSAGANMW